MRDALAATYTAAVMSSTPPALIGPDEAALIGHPVSIHVASRDALQRPHLMRAMGCRLSDDRRSLTLFLPAASSRLVLDDLRANGQIAVVFSEPSSHRTLQFKGRDAAVVAVLPGDEALVQAYIGRFAEEIGGLGFADKVAKTMFDHRPEDLVAVRFTPAAGFDQTPGPKAGEALGSDAARGSR
jgi:hypothetical protein